VEWKRKVVSMTTTYFPDSVNIHCWI
jgi:hypothetical protein